MTLSREPLHQPPNPEDLRRVPPASPACAEVRGMLRDFVDGDLTATEVRHVEEHASRCRTCSIELARSEHELLRLRSFFAVLLDGRAGSSGQGNSGRESTGGHGGRGDGVRTGAAAAKLPPDFAARLVERLVLDETSMVSGDTVRRAVAAADAALAEERRAEARAAEASGGGLSAGDPGAQAAGGMPGSGNAGTKLGDITPPRLRLLPTLSLVGALALLLGLVLISSWLRHDREPRPHARLVVLESAGAQGHELGGPNGLGNSQSLRIGPGGHARLEWHDQVAGPQPAATLQVLGEGTVRMHDGAPLLVAGRLDVATSRPVSIPLGDGSRLDFGIGEYTVLAELATQTERDDVLPPGASTLASAPQDVRVQVEVLDGQPATIVQSTFGPTLVASGQVGVFSTGSPVAVGTSGGGPALAQDPPRGNADVPGGGLSTSALLVGYVQERSGLPSVGAQIYFRFASNGTPQTGNRVTGADGQFQATSHACDSEFAIVTATPAQVRREIGMLAPDAVQVVKNGNATQFAAPLVFDLARAIDGQVLDDQQQPRSGVRVLPCIVDEVFGGVLPLINDVVLTGADGTFRIERMPARMPAHQSLVLVFDHDELEPAMRAAPSRGAVLANEPFGVVTMRQLRTLHFRELPAGTTVEIIEAVDAVDDLLPGGTMLRRKSVQTDQYGRSFNFHAGYGRLWYRVGSGQPQLLRGLVTENFQGVLMFRPHGPVVPFGELFRSLQAMPGTTLEMNFTYRHERFQTAPPVDPAQSQVLRAVDSLGRPIAGAQVFALDASGVSAHLSPRFLGFTSVIGILSLEPIRDDGDLVVIGPDGSIAFKAEPQAAGPVVAVTVNPTGRVLLHETLRPTGSLTLKFERVEDVVPGLRPFAVRIASTLNGWEFGDLPAGSYRVVINGQVRMLDVPAGGFVILQ